MLTEKFMVMPSILFQMMWLRDEIWPNNKSESVDEEINSKMSIHQILVSNSIDVSITNNHYQSYNN